MYMPLHRGFGCPGCLLGLGSFLDDLAAAITRQEGACSSPGSCTNNNPGNLRAGPGMIGTDSRGIAIFPDYATGYQALVNQEQLNINRGLTLSEFFAGKTGVYSGYAPAADSNQPNIYTANVSSWLGIPSDVPLSDLMTGTAPAVSSLTSMLPSVQLGDTALPGIAVAGIGLAALGLLFAVS